MEISILALIGIGLATMFFGYFFGLFEGRGQGYKKRKTEEATDPDLRAAFQASLPPTTAPPPIIPVQPAENNLLRLSMDTGEQPCLELDGQRVDTAQMQPEQRRRLIDLMVVMRPWIEGGPVARQQATAPARGTGPLSAPAPAPVATPPAPARVTGPLSAPAPA